MLCHIGRMHVYYMLPPCPGWRCKSQRLSLLQINLPNHSSTYTRLFHCYVSTFSNPGEGHDTKVHIQREHLSSPLCFSPTPFSLSHPHTSPFSSHLKRLPKDRSKKMNRSQRVSWQQCALARKHYLVQQEKVIIKA